MPRIERTPSSKHDFRTSSGAYGRTGASITLLEKSSLQDVARMSVRSHDWPTSRTLSAIQLALACALSLFAISPVLIGQRDAVAATPQDGDPDGGAGGGIAHGAANAADPATGSDDPIAASIDALIENEPGVYGVVLMRPDGRVLYNRNGDTPFVSASLYKLILLADVCKAVDDDSLTPDTPLLLSPEFFEVQDNWDSYFDPAFAGGYTTVQEAMYAAGAYSSNVAAMALLTVTSTDQLNQTAADLGLTGTFLFTDPTSTPAWPPTADGNTTQDDAINARRVVLGYASDEQVNLTTPMDMAHYFSLLMNGKLINERVSEMITAILREQTVNDRFPVLLPPDTAIVHKTGNLEHVIHDVGVIYAPDGPVILAAMVEAPANDERAIQVVQRLALIAYGEYDVPPFTVPVYTSQATPAGNDSTSVVTPDGTPEQDHDAQAAKEDEDVGE
jgi:beta-lactamase class A